MSLAHGTQKVHSKLQMQASPDFGVATPHFSQFSFISIIDGPSSCLANWPHHAVTLAPQSDPICDYIQDQSIWS